MKHYTTLFLILILLASCTENQRARNFGGTENIELPAGQRLINATWKQDDLWYLTEPMPEVYAPQDKRFSSKTSFGILEGEVIFHETK